MCLIISSCISFFFFFFNDTATTEIYTLSLHDALPILFLLHQEGMSINEIARRLHLSRNTVCTILKQKGEMPVPTRKRKVDRKSTRLNSSHGYISYAVFCLKKKKKQHYSSLSDMIL